MPLLYYWRPDNYRRDLDLGAGYHLNQASPRLHEIGIGESLWAFTRNRPGRYVLAAELVVRAKTRNPPGFRYGPYRVWGDLTRSRYFVAAETAPGIEQVIRSLSLRVEAARLGQAFQGNAAVRTITLADHQLLKAVAKDLALESRARILPEERLEAALLLEDEAVVRELLRDEPSGVAEARTEYLYKTAPTRNRALVQELHALYGGRCQLCGWDPRQEYGESLCHGHHLHWLSRGGDDTLENLLLVCPNHHGALHACDAQLDFDTLTFDFGRHTEQVTLNRHLSVYQSATLPSDG